MKNCSDVNTDCCTARKYFGGISPKTCLTVAGDAAFVPFEFVDEKNQIVGFDVDLAKAIERQWDTK